MSIARRFKYRHDYLIYLILEQIKSLPEHLNRNIRTLGFAEFPRDDSRVKRIIRTIDSYQKNHDTLIQVFHYVQDIYGYSPLDMIAFVSREMRVPPSRRDL
jgi:hypothetical protein